MRLHKRLVFPLAVALGAAVVVLPAAAASENPTINAYSYLGTHYWTPMEVTVSGGGSVAIRNSSEEVKHGVEWKSGPETPSCEGVPVGTTEAASATKWSGTCTFKAPGTYVFWCTVHHS